MMLDSLSAEKGYPSMTDNKALGPPPELYEWLRSGRLSLINEKRESIRVEQWDELPAHVQANAVAEFRRVVRGNTKAAVIFLRG
jgi:hypothetical protein